MRRIHLARLVLGLFMFSLLQPFFHFGVGQVYATIGTGPVVFHHIYGGGGNTGAPYESDFIVLRNISAAPVNITGWTIQNGGATSALPLLGRNITLSGSIIAGGYYLIEITTNTTAGIPLSTHVTPNLVTNFTTSAGGMGNNNNKLRLLDTSSAVIDFVGFGSTTNEALVSSVVTSGGTPAVNTSNTGSLIRTATAGTNSTDYAIQNFSCGVHSSNVCLLYMNSYLVQFLDHDTTLISSGSVAYGNNAIAPTSPTRTGYTFTGWSPSSLTNITSATNFTAQYTINQYTLSFDSASGSAILPITQDFNTIVTPPVNPTRTGYTFAGWSPSIPATMPALNQSHTGTWDPITYNISFDANRGTGTMLDQIFAYDTAQNLTTNSYTRAGYTFTGWNTQANGSGTGYLNNENLNNLTTTSGATIPVFAQWTDTGAPVVTLTGSGTVTIEVGSPYTELGASWIDNEDGSGSIVLANTGSVNNNVVEVYTLQYSYDDVAGNIGNVVSRTVNVVDTTKPVITLSGSSVISIYKNTSYSDAGATWTDNYDGSGSLTASGSVDTNTLGTYTLTYDHIDANSNAAVQVTRTIHVIAGGTPGITLIGLTPIQLEVFSPYTDTGAIWIDTEDGSGSITASGTVNIHQIGSYTLTYDYTDTQSNIATQVVRTVNVVDTTKPLIILNGSGTLSIIKGYSYTDAGASWTDNYDGSGSLTASGTVDTTTLGTYTLTYNHTDANSNVATQVTRSVQVVAGNTPLIMLTGSGAITLEVGSSYSDAGAIWTDTEDGSGSVIGSGTVDINTVGSHTLNYNHTDISGNNATQVTRTVNIVDTTKPVIMLSGSSVLSIYKNTSYTDTGASWTDNYDGSGSLTASGSVNTTTLGTYTLTYDITDSHGNVAVQVTRSVQVIDSPSIPSGSTSGGGGSSGPIYDRCNGKDTSGSIYDGICSKVSPLTQETVPLSLLPPVLPPPVIPVEPQIPFDTTPTHIDMKREVQGNTIGYTLKNTFDTCPIVDALNDANFLYEQNIFLDTLDSPYKDIINTFGTLKITHGNSNKLFEPKRIISRAEFTKMVLISHCYTYQDEDTTKLSFSDLSQESWQARVVSKAQKIGIINGYDDGTFRPNDAITKAEATKILMRMALVQTQTNQTLGYTDIETSWVKKYVEIGETLGVFDPQKDAALFRPSSGVTREDMVHMIHQIVDLYR